MSQNIKIFIIALVAVIVIAALTVVGGINKVITFEETVKSSWAQVENVLQRRFDLIPNLVETVKGYASHEKEVFVEVTNARSKVAQAGSIPEKIEANQSLTGALSRLMVVVEQYPQLKANENFLKLQDELAGTENRIAVERRRYNEAVKEFNAYIRRIPGRFYASWVGAERLPYFEIDEGAKQTPKVSF
ncbi:MAG: LemA family protein [Candidatus Auribacterota bacterium]|jgi:LemA protein|nr:LemA family protein [Candidatus Auribacterota bacterium]